MGLEPTIENHCIINDEMRPLGKVSDRWRWRPASRGTRVNDAGDGACRIIFGTGVALAG